MKQTFQNVEPIRPGYDWTTDIGFEQPFWDAMQLGSGRIVAQFRATIDSAVLFEADSAEGSILRPGGRILRIAIPAAATAAFASLAVFDFVRIDGAARTAVPGRWQWPVMKPVTRNVV